MKVVSTLKKPERARKLRHEIRDGPTKEEFFKSYNSKMDNPCYVKFVTEIGKFTCKITKYQPEGESGKSFIFNATDDCDNAFDGWYCTETKEGWIEW